MSPTSIGIVHFPLYEVNASNRNNGYVRLVTWSKRFPGSSPRHPVSEGGEDKLGSGYIKLIILLILVRVYFPSSHHFSKIEGNQRLSTGKGPTIGLPLKTWPGKPNPGSLAGKVREIVRVSARDLFVFPLKVQEDDAYDEGISNKRDPSSPNPKSSRLRATQP
jgi:hypothetical protein